MIRRERKGESDVEGPWVFFVPGHSYTPLQNISCEVAIDLRQGHKHTCQTHRCELESGPEYRIQSVSSEWVCPGDPFLNIQCVGGPQNLPQNTLQLPEQKYSIIHMQHVMLNLSHMAEGILLYCELKWFFKLQFTHCHQRHINLLKGQPVGHAVMKLVTIALP